jgi:hypothetical protein
VELILLCSVGRTAYVGLLTAQHTYVLIPAVQAALPGIVTTTFESVKLTAHGLDDWGSVPTRDEALLLNTRSGLAVEPFDLITGRYRW